MSDAITSKKTSPYFTDEKIRLLIDDLLRQNASIEANLGRDSTSKEKIKAKVKQDRLFGQIKKLDKDFYDIIVIEEDRS